MAPIYLDAEMKWFICALKLINTLTETWCLQIFNLQLPSLQNKYLLGFLRASFDSFSSKNQS